MNDSSVDCQFATWQSTQAPQELVQQWLNTPGFPLPVWLWSDPAPAARRLPAPYFGLTEGSLWESHCAHALLEARLFFEAGLLIVRRLESGDSEVLAWREASDAELSGVECDGQRLQWEKPRSAERATSSLLVQARISRRQAVEQLKVPVHQYLIDHAVAWWRLAASPRSV